MDEVRYRLNILHRRLRHHAVAEIEDVARSSGGATKNIVGSGEQTIARREEQCWIEIALDAAIRSNRLPRVVESLPPVDPDHVAAGFGEVAEDRRRTNTEMNHGDT
jgi:hypothetical protein